MYRKKLLIVAIISFIVITATLVVYSIFTVMPNNPLEGSEQLVLVVSQTENAHKGVLHAFDRDGDTWRFNFSCPVVIGKNGMAWGRGHYNERLIEDDEPVKVEGDGRTPKGVYDIIQAFGYPPPESVRIKFPYTQITPDLICIDDVSSDLYNVITSEKMWEDGEKIPSHENLLRNDDLYKYLIQIDYNPEKIKGAGSCILFHIWEDEDSYTAGCTAMSEASMLQFLAWLNPDKKPRVVQLTRRSYNSLQKEWGLPDVTI